MSHIFKKENPPNYRPVLQMPILVYKLLEHIIFTQLRDPFDQRNSLVENQQGTNCSCETQFVTISDLASAPDFRIFLYSIARRLMRVLSCLCECTTVVKNSTGPQGRGDCQPVVAYCHPCSIRVLWHTPWYCIIIMV